MRKYFVILLAVVMVGLLGFVGMASAADYRTSDIVVVEADEIIDDDLFISGNSIQIDGVVVGDIYAAGQSIIINGRVGGDVIAAGATIAINGGVNGSVRVAGQSLRVSGSDINGGLTFFGQSLTVTSTSAVGNGVVFFGEKANLDGSVAHGVTAFASEVTINSEVGTNSQITAQNLNIGENAVIAGDISYQSDIDAVVADGAEVAGQLDRTGDLPETDFNFAAMQRGFALWSFLAALFTGAVLLLLARRPTEHVAQTIASSPLPTFGWGLLTLLVSLPLVMLLSFSIVGVPLALLYVTGLIVALYLAKIFVGLALGKLIIMKLSSTKKPNVLLSLLVGLVALYLINLIPIITVFASLIVGALGVGAVVLGLGRVVRGPVTTTKKK